MIHQVGFFSAFCFIFSLFFISPRSVVMTELWWRTGRSYCWEPPSI